ncbi:MAG: ATP-binding cassette domain-containing protein [Eubacterium sp.]|nr:ATP-binding cassette domain-containing protein [Eubacterium sp.]
MEKPVLIQIDDISKQYKKQHALLNCNLSIYKGNIYGIVGPNGAGKTTLFKILLGLTEPSGGKIIYDGNLDFVNANLSFGALIEEPYLNRELTAYQNLMYIQILAGKENKEQIDEVLKLVGLDEYKSKKIKKYSLGMKQRLGIAMAIINNPEVLILDEPMNGLDPEGIIEIRNILLELNQKSGTTIIISSHILGELDKLVTDYIFLKNGEILLSDSRDNIQDIMEKNGLTDFEEFYLKKIKAYE